MVEKLTAAEVSRLSLKDRLTLGDLEKVLQGIRVAVEIEISKKPANQETGFLAHAMMPSPVLHTTFYHVKSGFCDLFDIYRTVLVHLL